MASLHEYYVKDGSRTLTLQRQFNFKLLSGVIYVVLVRLHLDFISGAKYISFFFPDSKELDCPEAIALNDVPNILNWDKETYVASGMGNEKIGAENLSFIGFIYIYSERDVPDDLRSRMLEEGKRVGHHLIFRSVDYMNERNKWEKPRAFISHDTRDKLDIAQPLALSLLKAMCPVWYDEFSLKVGDSLRGSIETGLKECHRCILILTPNFLNNESWGKKEYDSIFTRELLEKENVILPIWHQVTAKDVCKYSPALADRVAVDWSKGIDEVTRKLLGVLN
jgi:TIR domain